MAPKLSKPSKDTQSKKAAKPAKPEKSDADEKRKRQSNMVTQLKASEQKKQKVDAGLIEVSEDEKAKLVARSAFLEKYRGVEKAELKVKMLEQFENDKTCKTWQSCFSKSVTHSQKDTDEQKEGYKTSHLESIEFLKGFFLNH